MIENDTKIVLKMKKEVYLSMRKIIPKCPKIKTD